MNALYRCLLLILGALGLGSFQSVSYSALPPPPSNCAQVINSATFDCQLPTNAVTVTETGEISGEYGVVNMIPGAEGIINSGRIVGQSVAIFNMASDSILVNSINSITNLISGTMDGGWGLGIVNQAGLIQSISNAGEIRGNQFGILSRDATIQSLTNTATGTINTLLNGVVADSSWAAIYNTNSSIRLLNNSGLIEGSVGIYNGDTSSITTLNNFASGVIRGRQGIRNENASNISVLNNFGMISGGITNSGGSTIDTLMNVGVISAEVSGIKNVSQIGTLTNSGLISGYIGISNSYDNTPAPTRTLSHRALIHNLTNLEGGSIIGNETGIYNNNAEISLLSNTGSISALNLNAGIESQAVGINNSSGNITTLVNNGNISAGADSFGFAIQNQNGTISSLINNGIISAASPWAAVAIYNDGGTIDSLINSGRLEANISSPGLISAGIDNQGTITTLTNRGSITVPTEGVASVGIWNSGTIVTLNNAQGGNATSVATTALTYDGNLPSNYNIIINSLTHYGQLVALSGSGSTSTIFGISSLSTTSRSLINATFASVLTGISADQLGQPGLTSISGVSGIYSYLLSLTDPAFNIWGLTITACQICKMTIVSGETVTLSQLAGEPNLIMAGGTLALNNGDQSSQNFAVETSSTITAPTTGSATLSGVFSGPGGLTFNGVGTTSLTGANTYTGGTTVASGTLSVAGPSPTGFGDVTVYSGATLMGTGTINGNIYVAGILKPGHSPGYLAATGSVTMNAGSTYQQDIAGNTPATSSTTVGATGYYSKLNITGGQFIINSGATLTPRLSNLFSVSEAGYGSTPYIPVLGDRFRIVTASGAISGKFLNVTQPAELAAGTQFVPFYNIANSNSLDLAVIPTSYQTTISAASGNKNAQSVGGALDRMVVAAQKGTSTAAQDQLLYATSAKNAASLSGYTQGLSGEVYPATVAVIAQTTQRVQQAVQNRLGDTMGLSVPSSMTNPAGNTALMGATNTILNSGVASAAVSTNPNVNPKAEAKSYANGNVWGELAYQNGQRSSDSYSGGWSSNLYQLVFGSDFISANGMKLGGGLALSSTTLKPSYGSATIQQGSVFAYGKMPVEQFVVDAMASIGMSSSDISRSDVAGLGNGFRNKSVSGNDVMVSLGVSRPFDVDNFRVTPFARVTWQIVAQSRVNEGDAASALSVSRYTGNGVRGMLGVAGGSKAIDPMTEQYTYRAYVGVGADSSGILNPSVNSSLAGMSAAITTPNAGTTFVQAGLYGTAKFADNAYAYVGLSGETRSGQRLGAVNVGLRLQF
jgi:autotransporter-associated beta strand protein